MPLFTDDPVSSVCNTETPAISGESSLHVGVSGTSHDAQPAIFASNDFSPPDPPGAGGNGGWFQSTQGEGVRGQTNTAHHGGVVGVNTAGGFGVYGTSDAGQGVVGESKTLAGIFGRGPTGGRFEGGSGPAVDAEALGATGEAVRGVSHSLSSAILARNDFASDDPAAGGNGGWFESTRGEGVRGVAATPHHGGVVGVNTAGGFGVYGTSDDGAGVVGESKTQVAVFGKGAMGGRFEGQTGPALQGISLGGGPAGFFDGNVIVTGDVQLAGADLAEEFGIIGDLDAEPGSVVVVAGDDQVRVSDTAYDHRVAGVVSGAGSYRAGLVLDRQQRPGRRPLALTGKVWCKVDASNGPIRLGDLLTTSATPGHAMRATDPVRAFGAVIGKALGSLESGRGEVPVLVSLQ